MQIYSRNFADVYDLSLANFAKQIAPTLEKFYSNINSSKNNKLLDLCCGTGQLANFFLRKGYRVVGIDASRHMLKYAKKHSKKHITNGKAKFILGNILEQEYKESFGLVTCTYDSINHLENNQELARCFSVAYGSLIKDGYFVFDINTRKSLAKWNGINVIEGGELLMISRGIYDDKNSRATIRFSGFYKIRGKYQPFSQTIHNTIFDTTYIENLLRDMRWSRMWFAKKSDLSIPISNPENIDNENELIIIAQK